MVRDGITVVSAVNDMDVFTRNLGISPCLENGEIGQVIIKRDSVSASLAYNEAIDESANDIIIFVHQDVYLPEGWISYLNSSLSCLQKEKAGWGVLGCYGTRGKEADGIGQVYTNGLGVHGRAVTKPEPVDSLDEIVLIVRKSSGLRFDPSLPHFHMYGTDICLAARVRGLQPYAIQAFCIHNTDQIIDLPEEFYECYGHIKRRWKDYLPISTPCIKITLFNGEIYERRLRKALRALLNREKPPVRRAADPRDLLRKLQEGNAGEHCFIAADAGTAAKASQ